MIILLQLEWKWRGYRWDLYWLDDIKLRVFLIESFSLICKVKGGVFYIKWKVLVRHVLVLTKMKNVWHSQSETKEWGNWINYCWPWGLRLDWTAVSNNVALVVMLPWFFTTGPNAHMEMDSCLIWGFELWCGNCRNTIWQVSD